MTMSVELRDAELAEHLAKTLTDYEFEMLLRKRIEHAYLLATATACDEVEFSESYATCEFHYKWDDKCVWHVRVGTNYRDAVNGDGEVLGITWRDAVCHFMNQRENKLSLLLPAPKPTVFE